MHWFHVKLAFANFMPHSKGTLSNNHLVTTFASNGYLAVDLLSDDLRVDPRELINLVFACLHTTI